MKMDKISRASVNDLLRTYAEAAAAHGQATLTGDYRTANRHHDTITALYHELRNRGLDAQYALIGLLDHPDETVRLWAAAHALEFAPDEGRPVLEFIAQGDGIPSLTARVTLDEWKKGHLKFP